MKECYVEICVYVVNVKKGYHHPSEVVMGGYLRATIPTGIVVFLDCLVVVVGMIELGGLNRNPENFHRHRHGCLHVEAFAYVHRLRVIYFVFAQSVYRPTGLVSAALQ